MTTLTGGISFFNHYIIILLWVLVLLFYFLFSLLFHLVARDLDSFAHINIAGMTSTQFLLLFVIFFPFCLIFEKLFFMHIPGYHETYCVEQTGLSPGDLPASLL